MESKRKVLILTGPGDDLQRIASGFTKEANLALILFEEEPKLDGLAKDLIKEIAPQSAPADRAARHPMQKKNNHTDIFRKHAPLLAKRFKSPRRRG